MCSKRRPLHLEHAQGAPLLLDLASHRGELLLDLQHGRGRVVAEYELQRCRVLDLLEDVRHRLTQDALLVRQVARQQHCYRAEALGVTDIDPRRRAAPRRRSGHLALVEQPWSGVRVTVSMQCAYKRCARIVHAVCVHMCTQAYTLPLSEGAGEGDDDQRGHGVAHEHDSKVGPHPVQGDAQTCEQQTCL